MKISGKSANEADLLDLELPDLSGMVDPPRRLTTEAAFRLCEEYAAVYSAGDPKWHAQRGPKCEVEFKS